MTRHAVRIVYLEGYQQGVVQNFIPFYVLDLGDLEGALFKAA